MKAFSLFSGLVVGALAGLVLGAWGSAYLETANRSAKVAAELRVARQAMNSGQDLEAFLRIATALSRDPSDYAALSTMASFLQGERAKGAPRLLLENAKASIEQQLSDAPPAQRTVLEADLKLLTDRLRQLDAIR